MTRRSISIGISSCLLGEGVRYNGGHKRDRYVTEVLSEYFRFVPFCPEVAIGLGVPRATIRLHRVKGEVRAIQSGDGARDVTDELATVGRKVGNEQAGISGYILKSRSPSCGMERVRVHDDQGIPSSSAGGVFATALRAVQPLLPVEEEGRLNDPDLRDNFLERVFVFHRWQVLQRAGCTAGRLVHFHTENKFLVMAHDQVALRDLGRMVAEPGPDPAATGARYIGGLMRALSRPARRGNQANTLQHVAGFLKSGLDAGDRCELADSIDAFRRNEVPVIVPLTLLRHHLRRHPRAYLAGQAWLEQRPADLDTLRR